MHSTVGNGLGIGTSTAADTLSLSAVIHSTHSKTMQTGGDDTAVLRQNNFTSTFVIYIAVIVLRKYFQPDCLKSAAKVVMDAF